MAQETLADKLACGAWNKRMLAYKGQAQSSPTLWDALNAGMPISRPAASGAIHIRPLRSTSPIREVERSCGSRTAQRCVAIHTSAAI